MASTRKPGEALNERQKRFAMEYVKDLNAKQAAIRAGYSARTAESQGARLLSHAEVSAEVARRQAKRAERVDLSADRVLREMVDMAFWDPAELIEIEREFNEEHDGDLSIEFAEGPHGRTIITGLRSPRDIKFLPERVRRAIVGWGYDRNQNFQIKLADKSKALDQLGRHLGLFNDKLELSGNVGLADRLQAARRRIRGEP